MKTEFTSGPWISNSNGDGKSIALTHEGKSFIAVWDCSLDGTPFPSEANASLISAAPDLYAALEDMLSGWKYIRRCHGGLYGVGWDRAQDSAIAALKKARGEQQLEVNK